MERAISSSRGDWRRLLAELDGVTGHLLGWLEEPRGTAFACATNHADIDAIVDKFGAMPWRRADVVQLLIKDQEQEFFRLWMIVDGEGAQLTSAQPSGCEDADR
jgi:hypothetical protein